MVVNVAYWISVGIAVLVTFPALFISQLIDFSFYKDRKDYLTVALPPWLFMIVWPILYALISAAEILHFLSFKVTESLTNDYIALATIFVVNVAFNHMWSLLFFGKHNMVAGLIDAILLVITAVIVQILYATEDLWVSFWLYLPYTIWLIFAMCLNIAWIWHEKRMKKHFERTQEAQKRVF